jgi:hypothetical protein
MIAGGKGYMSQFVNECCGQGPSAQAACLCVNPDLGFVTGLCPAQLSRILRFGIEMNSNTRIVH